MNEGQPPRPANAERIVAINQGKRRLSMDLPRPPALTDEDLARSLSDGQLVLDTRSSAAFGAGHVPGSYHVHLSSPQFEQRVGWVTPPDVPLALVLERDSDMEQAVLALAFLGLDQRVMGYLAGGVGAWIAAGSAVATLSQVSVHGLDRSLRDGGGWRVLDVRESDEWDEGHVEGACHMSYKELGERLTELPLEPDEELAVVCGGGVRSSTACSILLRHGFERVHNVTGGMSAWTAAGLPLARSGAV
ncbi:MAG: rhodanese-like domain-containing protein [Gemmatimonadota bacterium]